MQKNIKLPCKWKQTFYYFVYKQPFDKLPKHLYHPMFGQRKIETPFLLSTINCTSDKKVALELASADSTMCVFANINILLSKGKLIAASIYWISADPSEQYIGYQRIQQNIMEYL